MMSIDRTPALVGALHNVLSISAAFGFRSSASSSCSTHEVLDIDTQFPSPPSLDSTLFDLGVDSRLVLKLSKAYERYALQLRNNSEITLRRAIQACMQFNSHLDIPAFNASTFHAVAVDIYTRNLREMANSVIASYHKAVQQSGCHSTIRIPRVVTPSKELLVLRRKNDATPVDCVRASHDSNNFHPSSSLGLASRGFFESRNVPRVSLLDDSSSKPQAVAVYKRPIDQDSIHSLMSGNPHAFPVQYVHPDVRPSRVLPSTSGQFFSNSTVQGHMRFSAERRPAAKGSLSDVMSGMEGLSLGSHAPRSDKKCMNQVLSNSSGTLYQPAKLSPSVALTQFDSSKRRGVLPSSRTRPSQRTSPRPQPPRPQSSSVLQASLSCSSRPQVHLSSPKLHSHIPACLPGGSSSSSTSQARKRKLAALPHRRGPTDPRNNHLSTSVSPNAESQLSRLSYEGASKQSLSMSRTPSRTPSLASLSCCSSDSLDSLDDCLDTPPSSPPRCSSPLTMPSSPSLSINHHPKLHKVSLVNQEVSFQFSFGSQCKP